MTLTSKCSVCGVCVAQVHHTIHTHYNTLDLTVNNIDSTKRTFLTEPPVNERSNNGKGQINKGFLQAQQRVRMTILTE